MVVDGFLDGLALLDGLDLLVHEVKILRLWRKRGDTLLLAAITVQAMVIIQADNGGVVRQQSVRVGVAT